eukprot:9043426-Karenia_brevis.AAC.1
MLRNVVYSDAMLRNMAPKREKAGLLPARPPEDGVRRGEPDGTGGQEGPQQQRSARRPADIFLPRGTRGMPMALDFACTSGMSSDAMKAAIDDPS